MDNQAVLTIFRDLLVKSHKNEDPDIPDSQLEAIKKEINENIHLDSPLSSVGLDSMKMTWIVVNLEEQLDIDASGISFFELYDINDLANQVLEIYNEKKSS